jgi:hypothetical protein
MGDDDPWETASRLRREAEAAAIAASDAIWTRLGDRENRGHPAQRYSPSLFR